MKNRNTFRSLVVLAALAAGTASMAQFTPSSLFAPSAVSVSYVEIKIGSIITIVKADGTTEQKEIKTQEELDSLVGAYAKLDKAGVEGVVTNVGRKACVAVYPGSFFITAGPVFDPILGKTTGGSLSVQGLLVAASFPINIRLPQVGGRAKKESEVAATEASDMTMKRPTFIPEITLGGWYFSRIGDSKGADLYQIEARYMTNDFFGLQLAYINSTDVDAESWTLHAVGRITSGKFLNKTNPWELTAGVGPYFNLSPRADNRIVPVIDNNYRSVGLSVYVNGSMKIKDRYSIHGTMWLINDRNTLTSRMALGVGYSF